MMNKQQEHQEALQPPPLTGGEKVFNGVTYWGVNGVVNTLISALAAYAASNSFLAPFLRVLERRSARKAVGEEAWSHELFTQGEKLVEALKGVKKEYGKMNPADFLREVEKPSADLMAALKKSEHLKDVSHLEERYELLHKSALAQAGCHRFTMFTLLFTGGFLLLAPVKWAEDAKDFFVKKLDQIGDKIRGHTPSPEEQQKREERYAYIRHDEPRQTWTSELASRLSSMAIIIPLYYTIGPRKNWLNKMVGRDVFKGTDYHVEQALEPLLPKWREIPVLGAVMRGCERGLKNSADWFAEIFAKGSSKNFTETAEKIKPIVAETHGARFTGAVATELSYAVLNATLLFLFTRLLAPCFGAKRGGKEEASAPSDAVPSAHPAAAVEPETKEHAPAASSHISTRPNTRVVQAEVSGPVLSRNEMAAHLSA